MIKQGNKSIIARMIGNKVIKATYKGALLVYQAIKKYLVKGVFPLTLLNTKGSKLIDYKMEGNSEQRILPRGYQQVEYIESTGTQYIDTGVIPNHNTGFDITFLTKNKFTNSTAEFGSVMGARESSTLNEYQITTFKTVNTSDRGTFRFGGRSYDAGLSENKKINITLLNKVYTNHDDITHNLTDVFSSPVNLTIFALNNNGSIVQNGKLQLYSLKLYDGDKLIRDYIPCYRISDNAIGLYDLVENKFYTNSGTGVFLKGNNIQGGTPTPDNPIEVVSVGERTKNLFNLKSSVDNSILIYNGNETYTFTKTNVDRYTKLVNLVIPANTKFTATAEIIEYTGTSLYPLGVQFQMEDGTFEGFTFSDTTKKYTTSYDRPTKAVRLFLQYGDEVGAYTKFKNLQIEFGSTATEYEPYGYKIPVVSRGKNLLNSLGRTKGSLNGGANTTIREFEFDKYYVGLTMNNYYYPHYVNSYSITDDSIIVNPLNTGYGVGYPVKVKPDTTYSVSCVEGGEIGVGFYTGNGELISYKEQPTEFITPENCEILTVILRPREKDVDTIYKSVQLEEGTTTNYEPYQEPITTNIYLDEPLRKVGDYADYIDFGNKKLVRNVGKFTFNNSFSLVSTGDYYITTYKESLAIDYNYPLMFAYLQGSTWTNKVNTIMAGNIGTIVCKLDFAEFPNSDVVNEFMNGKTVYFATKNSTEETIDLPSIPTLEGTTVLDSTQNPSYVEVEYTNEEPKTSVPLTLADGNTLLDSNGDYFNVKEV